MVVGGFLSEVGMGGVVVSANARRIGNPAQARITAQTKKINLEPSLLSRECL
jgi:hypothetical protein